MTKIAKSDSKISVFGRRQAIIGSQLGLWTLKREPDKDDMFPVSLYFDEDGPNSNLDTEIGQEFKGTEIWTGEGELRIPDFKYFIDFLKVMMIPSSLKLIDNE